MDDDELTLADFDFDLPPELIAQHPLADRAASRLLHVGRGALVDLPFRALPDLVQPGEVLVFNDTRVIRARLLGSKPSGGKVEILVERVLGEHAALALVRTSHAPRAGTVFEFGAGSGLRRAVVRDRSAGLFELEFDHDVMGTLNALGETPLPPYIRHRASTEDEARYQTVFARVPGAVAAPTAGLHFTDELRGELAARGVQLVHVTLHVGAGTFQPVRSGRIREHVMHAEHYEITADAARSINAALVEHRPVTAVGTTALRALESAARDGAVTAGAGETRLFVTPGFRFQVVRRLLTNFHLPRSTLFMLVAAFAGLTRIRAAYAHAIAQRYRFFSYGDAMLLERAA
ncbi:MAG TPA: tRNA preQ1(34) S-adenosylmethionine ribosyltransferase-isomerase QueA [Burkholderiaceae bacterium]|nr:tRNA preQ1(34) S-adenosylmethionine ribosyltransferase-isomerase QueA [Burkholderiaceae bacterium]